MKTAAQVLHEFVLERAADEPLRRRVELYRALAQLAPTPAESKQLKALASDCDAIDRSHAQLVLDFKRRAT